MKEVYRFLKRESFYILLLVFCTLLPFVLDMNPAFYGSLGSFALLLALRFVSFWAFLSVFVVVLLTSVLFLPQILIFGHPPKTMIASFFETDLRESKEFIKSLPLYSYLYSLLFLAFGLFIIKQSRKITVYTLKTRIIAFLSFLLLGVILSFQKPFFQYLKGEGFDVNASKTAIISFYTSVYSSIREYRAEKAEILKATKLKSTWQVTAVSPKYKDFVLVVGESVNRDYMSLYGFEKENSSFLKSVNGKILEGFTAAAPNTVSSLTRTFIQEKDAKFIYQNNIISLANEAGFETFWISNQGFAGGHDSTMAKIGSFATKSIFTKKYEYDSMNYNDFQIIPVFEKLLNQNSQKPRLFVLHLMGSHPFFEDRLNTPITFDYFNSNLSAYLQTLKQTDDFLSEIYKLLKNNHQKFSLLYFADHGLMSQDRNSKLFATLNHGDTNPKKSAYRVPFAMISSDDEEHLHIKVNKSAFNFLKGFASWLGIEENSLQKYDFFSKENDTLKVFNHFENVLYNTLENDPLIK